MTPVAFHRSTRSLVLLGLGTVTFFVLGLILPFQHPTTVSHAKLVVAGVAGLVFSLFSPSVAVLMRKSIGLLGAPLAIAAVGLDRPLDEVVAVMHEALAESRVRRGHAEV